MSKKTQIWVNFLLIFIVTTCFITCGRQECLNPKLDYVWLRLFRLQNGVLIPVNTDTVLSVNAEGREIMPVPVRAGGIGLILNPAVTELPLIFTLRNEDSSLISMQLSYETVLTSVEPACGFYPSYRNLSIIDHNWDSVSVLRPNTDTTNATSIRVVFVN